jgi:hypothetical protein
MLSVGEARARIVAAFRSLGSEQLSAACWLKTSPRA